jgi:hypothetical protein
MQMTHPPYASGGSILSVLTGRRTFITCLLASKLALTTQSELDEASLKVEAATIIIKMMRREVIYKRETFR